MYPHDEVGVKNPAAHALHLGWELVEPVALVYFPSGHRPFCSAQESVLLLLFDVEALKNPTAHGSHVGWEDADPGALVYLPGGHLVWAVHRSVWQPVNNKDSQFGKMCFVLTVSG